MARVVLDPIRPVGWTGERPPEFARVPEHVAIVMDGNGRWANRQGLTRIEGHRAGEASLLDVVAGGLQAGVKHISAYAFSTENWSRSPDEVRFILGFTERTIARHLYLPDMPDVDLFVRTSGEQRTSNFLLWQSAYAEMVFADTLWPDFRRRHLWDAIGQYADRERRFGAAVDAPKDGRSGAAVDAPNA